MIKSVLNWTFGSFFRTLGRLLCFLLVGGLIAFLISKLDIKMPKFEVFIDVHADTLMVGGADNESYAYINGNLFYMYQPIDSVIQNNPSTFRLSLTTLESTSQDYNFLIVDVCSSEEIWAYRTSSAVHL